MFGVKRIETKWSLWSVGVIAGIFLSGCSSVSLNRAPVEDRGNSSAPFVPPPEQVAMVKATPGSENAGKPGYYTVKPRDTLIAIGLENGASHKDIARWNNLENPNKIEVGQVLRVVPPVVESTTVTTKPVTSSTVIATAVVPGAPARPASAPAASASAPASTPAPAPVASASGEDDLGWIWPSSGVVISGFEEGKTKGIDIGGTAGDAVVAAADGRVIWAAAGEGTMRHYGNLIIVQHNKTFLTAYANNSTLLVKEDQRIKKGQKIAEMGSTGTDRVKLHFELRRMGIAVDPTKYLPPR